MDILKQYIGEDSSCEKKREVERRKVRGWLKTVSAFANGEGGIMLFGIDDDERVVGLADAKADAEFISQKIKERIDPVPQTAVSVEQTVEGKNIIAVRVFPGEDTPYYYLGEGALETYVRIANETVTAGATEHKRLVLRGKNSSFDARPTDELFDNFSFSKLSSRYYAWSGTEFSPKLYRSMGLVATDGTLTNAGLLVCDEGPLRQARVFCTRWNGIDRSGSRGIDATDSREITGSIITQIEDTLQFIRRNTSVMWRKEATQRREFPEYIERSVTEAIVNAVAHRDYLITGSEVHVDIYDDRLTVYSPGGMPEGRVIQELNIDDVPSVRRNPVIADVLAQLGYIERKGSGMGKILVPYRQQPDISADLMPRLASDRCQFTVTFPSLALLCQTLGDIWTMAEPEKSTQKNGETDQKTAQKNGETTQKTDQKTTQKTVRKTVDTHLNWQGLKPAQSAILDVLAVTPELSQKRVGEIIGLSESGVKYNISVLRKKGLLRHVGGYKGGRWVVTAGEGEPTFHERQGGILVIIPRKADEQTNDTENDTNDTENDTNDTNGALNLSETEKEMLRLLTENPYTTSAQLSMALCKSVPTIKRMTKKLCDANVIVRHGSKRNGCWQVLQDSTDTHKGDTQ